MNWYIGVLKKYAVFSGRAQRAEYWYFALFSIIISAVLALLDRMLGTGGDLTVGVLGSIYSLAILIPSIAVAVRRLHDTDRSGWWLFIGLIPIIGFIVLIIWFVKDSQPDENKYGPNPKGIAGASGSPTATSAAPIAATTSTPPTGTSAAPATEAPVAPDADTPEAPAADS